MESIKEFKKAVQTVDIIVENHYFANQMGYVRAKDFPEFDFKGFDKKMFFAVNKSTDAELRKLLNDAETSLILLSNEQLKKVILLLQPYTYKSFYKKLGAFTVMFTKGEAHPMHITDFIYEMKNAFICDIPYNKGDLTRDFLHDLYEDLNLKSGYVHAMIHRINKLLNEKKEEAPTSKPFDIPESVLQTLEEKKFIDNAKATPIKWLKNVQLLRELLMHEKIKKEGFRPIDVEKATPIYFARNGKPAKLSKNKAELCSDSDFLKEICDLITD